MSVLSTVLAVFSGDFMIIFTISFYFLRQRDSVVRTSVFGWWTFTDLPDLRWTCDHFVGKVSAMGQLRLPFLPGR